MKSSWQSMLASKLQLSPMLMSSPLNYPEQQFNLNMLSCHVLIAIIHLVLILWTFHTYSAWLYNVWVAMYVAPRKRRERQRLVTAITRDVPIPHFHCRYRYFGIQYRPIPILIGKLNVIFRASCIISLSVIFPHNLWLLYNKH